MRADLTNGGEHMEEQAASRTSGTDGLVENDKVHHTLRWILFVIWVRSRTERRGD